mgnify:CR=1 FL=1
MTGRRPAGGRALDDAAGAACEFEDGDGGVLDLDAAKLEELLSIDRAGWKAEMESIAEYLDEYGDRTPAALKAERAKIAAQLA